MSTFPNLFLVFLTSLDGTMYPTEAAKRYALRFSSTHLKIFSSVSCALSNRDVAALYSAEMDSDSMLGSI